MIYYRDRLAKRHVMIATLGLFGKSERIKGRIGEKSWKERR